MSQPQPEQPRTPAHTTGGSGLVVPYGEAGPLPVLALYEDFRCPYCAALEEAAGPEFRRFADEGRLRLEYHFAAFLDGMLGGSGSLTALGAAGAAVNVGQREFKTLHEALYAQQPDESVDSYREPAVLLRVAESVGLTAPAFREAVQAATYIPWAAAVAEAFGRSGVRGTPTLRLGGVSIHGFDRAGRPLRAPAVAAQLEAALEEAPAERSQELRAAREPGAGGPPPSR
ncbi:DsbA family protein [Streptomyces sp. NPDC004111]|uniref:DsbA family protein n=1 Tax=Streptomyces sp. NPDC004111 TaxID=3364690 RepID=UPI0036B7497D